MKSNILILMTCIFFISWKSFSQEKTNNTIITNEEYNVINDIFSTKSKSVEIYNVTDFSKTWLSLMSVVELDKLLGPPCNDGNRIIKWIDIFSKDDFRKIRDKIIQSKPMVFDKSKLNNCFITLDYYDNSNKNSTLVSSISKPIIIREYAIVKRSSQIGEVILIAKKNESKWEVICRKFVFQTSYD